MIHRFFHRVLWQELNFNFSIFALLASLFFAEMAFSKEVPVLEMTNDEDKEIAQLVLGLDDDTKDILKFIKLTLSEDRGVKARVEYNPKDLLKAGGLIIEKRKGRVIVALQSNNYAAHNGGDIILDTLYDGVKDKRKAYNFDLNRQGDEWEVYRDGQAIYKMHMKSKKKFIIGTVGIKDVITAPKGE